MAIQILLGAVFLIFIVMVILAISHSKKPFNELGGWLYFFWIGLVCATILNAVVIIFIYMVFEQTKQVLGPKEYISLITLFITAIFSLIMAKTLSIKDVHTPEKYIFIFQIWIILMLLSNLLTMYFSQKDMLSLLLNSAATVFGFLFQKKYFTVSKRVKVYYGIGEVIDENV